MKVPIPILCLVAVLLATIAWAEYTLSGIHTATATSTEQVVKPPSPPVPEDLSIRVISANWRESWDFESDINGADKLIKRGWVVASITAGNHSVIIVLQPPAPPVVDATKIQP